VTDHQVDIRATASDFVSATGAAATGGDAPTLAGTICGTPFSAGSFALVGGGD